MTQFDQAYQDAFAVAFVSLLKIALFEHILDYCLLLHLEIEEIERAVLIYKISKSILNLEKRFHKEIPEQGFVIFPC